MKKYIESLIESIIIDILQDEEVRDLIFLGLLDLLSRIDEEDLPD